MSEEMSTESGGGYLRGLVTGLLFGAAAALLLAPKRGEDLRQDLAEKGTRIKAKASDLGGTVAGTARDIRSRTEEFASTVRAKGSEVAEEATHYAHDVKAKVADTAEEVKAKATGDGQDEGQAGQGEPAGQAHDVVESV
ncbi:MAG: YtxH domain-containing protein [Armatimonadota bacterium]|nr:YtxH domain-containing protein [Armatimonadota bacterium]